MATTELRGTVITLAGELPAVGDPAPAYSLAAVDNSDLTGPTGRTVLNIFPSVDTGVCAASVREFNARAAGLDGVQVVCVSLDLPMALKRFCGAEGLDHVVPASAFRSDFPTAYGVTMADGPMRGLLARAVVVVDADGTVLHSQLVPQVSSEPDYDAALAALG